MNTKQLRDEILSLFKYAWEDKEKLEKIKNFLMEEIYEEEDNKIEIPQKYQKIIKEIAQDIDCGFTCLLNPQTLELERTTEDELMMVDDHEEFEQMNGVKWEDAFKHETWDKCISIEKPHSHEGFQIMENFTDQLKDNSLQNRLQNALNNRKPFANFNYIIHDSDYRDEWFSFKQQWLEKWVWNEIEDELNS